LGGVDDKLLRALERVTVGDLKPDLTFIMDVPAEVGMARAAKRRGQAESDRFEGEALDFHERLRDAFRMLALLEPQRCVLIDSTEARAEVSERIWQIVGERLDPATAPVALEGVAS
jgi:dTMP kinase